MGMGTGGVTGGREGTKGETIRIDGHLGVIMEPLRVTY